MPHGKKVETTKVKQILTLCKDKIDIEILNEDSIT